MNIKSLMGAIMALTLVFATSARAELRHVELKTLGMDSEICAHAVSVAMKKVPSVDQVRVSLKDGLTILDLKANNSTTLAELRRIIKNNGFVSKEATVIARGTASSDQKTFTVAGTNEQLSLMSPPQRTGEEWRLAVAPPAAR